MYQPSAVVRTTAFVYLRGPWSLMRLLSLPLPLPLLLLTHLSGLAQCKLAFLKYPEEHQLSEANKQLEAGNRGPSRQARRAGLPDARDEVQCGIGQCGRCNIGGKYVCKDGSVFRLDQIPSGSR